MYADYHLHSQFSFDSEYPMKQIVKDAIKLGINELCFTDHVEYGPNIDRDEIKPDHRVDYEHGWGLNVDYPRYFKRIDKLSKKYHNKIELKKGLEFGLQYHTIDRYKDLFDKYGDELDFVILSCHNLNDKSFWNQSFQQDLTQDEYYKAYYKALLYFVKNFKDYSVLGHLDHIVRYDFSGEIYESDEVDALIDEILKTVIADGKGIELNASYDRYHVGDTTPSRKILERFKELGGEIITIGSDSHKRGQLGDHVEEAKEVLRELGFEKFCTFNKMSPVFHQL